MAEYNEQLKTTALNKVWRSTGARPRYTGVRKKQVGVGKFPPTWFESMRHREVIMDRSEVIDEPDWIPEIEQHCQRWVPWLKSTPEEVQELWQICDSIDWSGQYGPPGKYIDIQYIHDLPDEYHEPMLRQVQRIRDRIGELAVQGDPPNFSRILPRSCMHPHRDTPLRWCVLYLPLPAPGQIYAPTEHLWEDGKIYGVHNFPVGDWLIFNQDIWHAANNFTDQARYTFQVVLDTSYEDFVEKFC